MRHAPSDSGDDAPTILPSGFLTTLTAELDGPDVIGIALGGSFARGAATASSDVDLAPFYRTEVPLPPKRIFWRDNWLVSVSPKTVDGWRMQMARPESAIQLVPSAAHLHILLDKDGSLASLVAEAQTFRWEPLQPAADAFAGHMLMLLAELALKVLGAVAREDDAVVAYPLGELLHDLSWIVATQRGILIESGNTYFRQVQASLGSESDWSRTHRAALGIRRESLRERADAVLQFYVATARLIADVLGPEEREVVTDALARIARAGHSTLLDHTSL